MPGNLSLLAVLVMLTPKEDHSSLCIMHIDTQDVMRMNFQTLVSSLFKRHFPHGNSPKFKCWASYRALFCLLVRFYNTKRRGLVQF